jgi:hypothetical protein
MRVKRVKRVKARRKTAGGSSSADVSEVTDSLEALRAAIERLAKMPPQVVDDCDARWLVAACVAADCAAFSSAASRVDSSSNTPVVLATIDVMTAARKAMATLAAADEASAAFALAGSTSDKRAILADASLAMTARVQQLLMEASGAELPRRPRATRSRREDGDVRVCVRDVRVCAGDHSGGEG